ncbi:MAG: hypothetical protein OXI66_10855 [Boseongicola sp.]|nr:hypothetical protein [Boseongicola sp.]
MVDGMDKAATLVALGQALPKPAPNEWRCGAARDRENWERANMKEELRKCGFGRMTWTALRNFGRRIATAYGWDWTEDPERGAQPGVSERD